MGKWEEQWHESARGKWLNENNFSRTPLFNLKNVIHSNKKPVKLPTRDGIRLFSSVVFCHRQMASDDYSGKYFFPKTISSETMQNLV